MLTKRGEAHKYTTLGVDLAITILCWVLAYLVRFDSGLLPVIKGRPPISFYLVSLLLIVPIWGVTFNALGLYSPWRIKSIAQELVELTKAILLSVAVLSVFSFFYREIEFSRLVIAIFVSLNVALLCVSRTSLRVLLRKRRNRPERQRRVIVVGVSELSAKLIARLERHPWVGLRVVGVVRDEDDAEQSQLNGVPIVGSVAQLRDLAAAHSADEIFITLNFERMGHLRDVLRQLAKEHYTIRLVPDLFQFGLLINASVDDIDGLPVINLVDSPMVGINSAAKRLFDVSFSLAFMVIFAPIYAVISLAVKLSSPGPVFYRQQRMGFDGRAFEILKFRSMPVGAEASGPVWNTDTDTRAQGLGRFLRRSSLDELPQFWNVFRGEMSVVGPRPERPVFIEKFKHEIPRYNLRHKIKAGITGWAQINGWRGDTSIEKRIEYDLYYIENWSLGFDIKIIFLTVFRGLIGKNTY